MKELTGKEASLLAFLAQVRNSPKVSPHHAKEVLSELDGFALQVGKVLLGKEEGPSAEALELAEDFIRWAESLGKRG